MSKHLNLSTIIDKNKVTSENVFLMLIEVDVTDNNGNLVETIRFCKNSENIVYKTHTYTASNFDLDISMEANQEPKMTLKAEDQTRALGQYVDAYDGLVEDKLRLIIVNSGSLDNATPEMEEEFTITFASITNYVVTVEIGVETAVALRFPNFRQFKERCVWKFKGPRCKYAGAATTCSYVRHGTNGCIEKANEINFGGFPGINEVM